MKVNVQLQFEGDGDPKDSTKYPLAVQHAGVCEVKDRAEAERVIEMLSNHVRSTFIQMSVLPAAGQHVPDLAAAKGGVPEVKSITLAEFAETAEKPR